MKRIDQPELLDNLNGSITAAELAENLADLARINRWLGTRRIICRAVWHLIKKADSEKLISVIDIGAGTGDVLALLREQADRRGKPIRALALEHDPAILDCLHRASPDQPAIGGDALHLPIASHSMDIVICTQMLHHLTPDQVIAALSEFQRIARGGVVLFDLERSRLAMIGAWLITHLISRNRLTRNDGVLSTRRAYRLTEIQAFMAQIHQINNDPSINSIGIWRYYKIFPFRWLAVYALEPR